MDSGLGPYAEHMKSNVGACYPGSHANFRGHDLHAQLRGMDWVELYLFGITGRRFTPAQIRLVHAIWVYTSYPDARLWNNRIVALAASSRSSSNLGMSAAIAVSEAKVFGGQAGFQSMQFLLHANAAVKNGTVLHDFVLEEMQKRRIYGYGRPINSKDERIPWMMALLKELGLNPGPHVDLAFAVEAILIAKYPQLRMNYAALHAALMADMGLSLREYQLLRVPTFMAGMAPCSVDAAANPVGTVFPTPCDAICYSGESERPWPR